MNSSFGSEIGERPGFRSGFIAVLGLPNSGKSTLINAFFDRQPLIVSAKPQTSRFQVRCISTTEERQAILVDTPGWHAEGRTLGKFMRREIARSVEGTDATLFVVDAARPQVERVRYAWGVLLKDSGAPVVLVLNKIDLVGRGKLPELLDKLCKIFEPKEIVPVSALKKENLLELDRVVTSLLPEGPLLYPPDTQIDKPDEFLFGEFIREQVYRVAREEVPFSCAVHVETVEQGEASVRIEAELLVERDSQKAILIGAAGQNISKIRTLARDRIRRFTGSKVQLELRVKVHARWASDEKLLERMGHSV